MRVDFDRERSAEADFDTLRLHVLVCLNLLKADGQITLEALLAIRAIEASPTAEGAWTRYNLRENFILRAENRLCWKKDEASGEMFCCVHFMVEKE